MKLGLITGNSLRHNYLGTYLSQNFETIHYIETSTVNNITKSKIMKDYFLKVQNSENLIFEKTNSIDSKADKIFLPKGQVNNLEFKSNRLLDCDCIIVFGSSIIKDPLFSEISDKKLINLHMGISPYYLGSACNFWAMYDNNIQYVGGTIQTLSRTLDMGNTLKYCYPNFNKDSFNPFNFSMEAVMETINNLPEVVNNIDKYLSKMAKPDDAKLIRHSKINDFNDEIVTDFYKKELNLNNITKRLINKN